MDTGPRIGLAVAGLAAVVAAVWFLWKKAGGQEPEVPVANFTAIPATGVAPLPVVFQNTSTGSITSYAWAFGDGGTSATASPSHVYQIAGTYTATLTVAGPDGSSDTAQATITVTAAPSGRTPIVIVWQ